jgi:hypothetical protein
VTQQRYFGAPFAAGAVLAVVAVAALTPACRSSQKTQPAPAASSSALPAPVASGLPIPADAVARVVNPGNLPPYAGPVAKVRGVVRSAGEAPPDLPEIAA